MATAVHWFNPLAWVAASCFRADREVARDRMVLRAASNRAPRAYGELLLRLMEGRVPLGRRLATVGLVGTLGWGLGSDRRLRHRIGMIAGFAAPARRAVTTLVGLAMVGLVGCSTFTRPKVDSSSRNGNEVDFVPLLAERSQVLQAVGRTDEAVALARRVAANWDPQTRWWADPTAIHMLRRAGLMQEARDYADRLLTTVPADYKLRSFVSVALGQNDEALEQLSRLGAPSSTMGALFYSSLWDEVRGDPRFMKVITGLGMGKAYETARAARARLSAEQEVKK